MTFKIVKYTPAYKQAVIDLLKYMWKEYDEQTQYELFKWRYEDNPYEKSIIFMAVENERVIGFRAFIAQIFVKGDKQYTVFSPSDTIIHREHRRKGIISALNDKCLEEINRKYKDDNVLLINTSTSKPSMPVYLKQGWQKSNGLRRFYFKTSILNYCYVRSNGNGKAFLSEFIEVNTKNYRIEISSKVKSSELSEFNAHIRSANKWTNVRDVRFFNWRYLFLPEKYTFVYCYLDNKLEGYLIIKQLTDKKSTIDQYEATHSRAFNVMVNTAVKTLHIAQLRSYAFLPEEKEMVKKGGFIPESVYLLEKFGRLRFPVLVRPKNPQPEDKDFMVEGQDIREITNWHLQISDRH